MNDPRYDVGYKAEGPGYAGGYAPAPPRSRGCFFYGCLFSAVAAGLLLVLVVAAVVTLGYYARRMVDQYTATAPEAIPVVDLPEEQQQDLDARWDAFKQALEKGEAATLVLTADEVNALISREPKLRGRVLARIKGDELTAQISVPLAELKIPGLAGRFLNGTGTFTAATGDDGVLDVRLRDLVVNGKKLPEDVKAQISGKNLIDHFVDDPENRKFIRKIKSVEVKDDKVYLATRKVPSPESKETPEAEAKETDAARKDDRPDADKTEDRPDAESKPADDAPAKKND